MRVFGERLGAWRLIEIEFRSYGDSATSPTPANRQNELIYTADSFAKRFSHFEWKYLCSNRWFLKGVAQALETNDFSSLQIKAEMALADAHLR